MKTFKFEIKEKVFELLEDVMKERYFVARGDTKQLLEMIENFTSQEIDEEIEKENQSKKEE